MQIYLTAFYTYFPIASRIHDIKDTYFPTKLVRVRKEGTNDEKFSWKIRKRNSKVEGEFNEPKSYLVSLKLNKTKMKSDF